MSPRYCDDKILRILQNHPVLFIYKTTKKMILNESDDNEQFTKFELKNVLNKFLNML